MDLIDIWKQLLNKFLRCNLFYGIQFVNQEAIILYKDVVCWQSWTFLVRYLCSVWLQMQTSFFFISILWCYFEHLHVFSCYYCWNGFNKDLEFIHAPKYSSNVFKICFFFSSPLFCQSAFLYPGRVLHSKIAICVFYKNDSKF